MTHSINKLVTFVLASAAVAFAGAGCESWQSKKEATAPAEAAAAAKPMIAKAPIEGRSGSKLVGEAVFTEAAGAVQVVVTVTGAAPGKHAVHIHEKGDCSAPDATSAGSHFNPDGHKHGAPDAGEHHAGDFGNMDVGADGTGRLELSTKSITLSPGAHCVVGRAIIVHEKPDDFGQPVGNAGGRIGCGVIASQ